MGVVDRDDVVAEASPVGDAAGEVTIQFIGSVGDERGRQARDFDIVDACVGDGSRIGQSASAIEVGLVADHEQVFVLTGVEMQGAFDATEIATQEVRRMLGSDIGLGGHVDPVIPVREVDVGHRAIGGALHVENVVAGAEVYIQCVHPVVVDPVGEGSQFNRSYQVRGVDIGRVDQAGECRALEGDMEGGSELGHRHVFREGPVIEVIVRIEDRIQDPSFRTLRETAEEGMIQ